MIYQGENWPEQYRGKLFTLNFHGRRINEERLEPRGQRRWANTCRIRSFSKIRGFGESIWIMGLMVACTSSTGRTRANVTGPIMSAWKATSLQNDV